MNTQECDSLVPTGNTQAHARRIRQHLHYEFSGRECGPPVAISIRQAHTRLNTQECDSLLSTGNTPAHTRVTRSRLHYEFSRRECGALVAISNGQARTRVNSQECDSLVSTSNTQAYTRVVCKHEALYELCAWTVEHSCPPALRKHILGSLRGNAVNSCRQAIRKLTLGYCPSMRHCELCS